MYARGAHTGSPLSVTSESYTPPIAPGGAPVGRVRSVREYVTLYSHGREGTIVDVGGQSVLAIGIFAQPLAFDWKTGADIRGAGPAEEHGASERPIEEV